MWTFTNDDVNNCVPKMLSHDMNNILIIMSCTLVF